MKLQPALNLHTESLTVYVECPDAQELGIIEFPASSSDPALSFHAGIKVMVRTAVAKEEVVVAVAWWWWWWWWCFYYEYS